MIISYVKDREEYILWRKRNRVRLIDVARYSNCSIALLSLWENGKANISDGVLEKYNEYITLINEGKKYADNN